MIVRPLLVSVLSVSALLSSCGEAEVSSGPQRPPLSDPAVGSAVATLDAGETTFRLYDEGDGCVALGVDHPGLQSTVERRCFGGDQVLALSSECGWLVNPADPPPWGCDVALPIVAFGQVLEPGIGFVCVATGNGTGVEGIVSTRLMPFDERGYILTAAHPGESPHAHLFTSGGLRYGEPPLDAPSDPIYRLCEEQAPWGIPEVEFHALVFVDLAESLRRDDVVLSFDAGTGRLGLSGAAVRNDELLGTSLRVPASSAWLAITLEVAGSEPLHFIRIWPDGFQAILDGDTDCEGSIEFLLAVNDATASGSGIGVQLDFLSVQCGDSMPDEGVTTTTATGRHATESGYPWHPSAPGSTVPPSPFPEWIGGDRLVVGESWHFWVVIDGCGFEFLGRFNGTIWKQSHRTYQPGTDGRTLGLGDAFDRHVYPDTWDVGELPVVGGPLITVDGVITLVDSGRIEATTRGGELIAVYETTDESRPYCIE